MLEPGFYWVRYYNYWTIAEYVLRTNNSCDWYVIGEETQIYDDLIQEIGPKIENYEKNIL